MLLNEREIKTNGYRDAKSRRRNILRQDSPGDGTDGHVWKTSIHSAIKAFYRQENFNCELQCYKRLRQHGVNEIFGLNVPVLEDYDAELRVIEMTFVQAPYLLDFGKATVDAPPSHLLDPRDARRFEAEWRSEFGSRFPEVNAVLYVLQSKYGIYYLDPKPANIKLDAEGDEDDDDWMKEPPIDYSSYD